MKNVQRIYVIVILIYSGFQTNISFLRGSYVKLNYIQDQESFRE